MAVRLNRKNRFYILVFIILVVGMVLMLLWSVKKTNEKSTIKSYKLSNNSVVFTNNSNIVDNKLGGTIEKKWDGEYYFLTNDVSTLLGDFTIVYEKATENLKIYGESYKIYTDGNVVITNGETKINDLSTPGFYKLADREYLIVGNEIGTEDRTIFTNKFLRVSLDKQGNASFYNDVINVKTITPVKIKFGEFEFNPALETLTGAKVIDLKKVIGSTNTYTPPSTEAIDEYNEKVDFISKYNELVNDFTAYAKENNIVISDSTTVTNNFIVANEKESQKKGKETTNKTKVTKNIALRGTISYPTYIDVTYLVTDPEDKYQVVYLIVDGVINGEEVTKKIILDKYSTTYRISGLNMKSEYAITLGDIEIVTDEDTEKKSLVDNIEDVINVRTSSSVIKIDVQKIAKGNVYFNIKMSEEFAISSGKVVVLNGKSEIDETDLNIAEARSPEGFNGILSLNDGKVFTIAIKDAYYGNEEIHLDTNYKFSYSSAEK